MGPELIEETTRPRMSAQDYVYAAAKSEDKLRCGDRVLVEWEGQMYEGMVSDLPSRDEYSVTYKGGDFEESVPKSAISKVEPHTKQPSSAGKRKNDKNSQLLKACNQGDSAALLKLLRAGADPECLDDIGYSPIHWAAGPEEWEVGDTISRRACLAILLRVASVSIDKRDGTQLMLRAVQHATVRNLVGCVRMLASLGADLSGTVHWAVSCKAHGVLRELLQLGAKGGFIKGEWMGSTPLMLAAMACDCRSINIMIEHTLTRGGGERALRQMLNEKQVGSQRASALHLAAEYAADPCVELLLEHGADHKMRTAKGDSPLQVAKRRLASSNPETLDAARRCVELLEAPPSARKRELLTAAVKAQAPSTEPLLETNGGKCSAAASFSVEAESPRSVWTAQVKGEIFEESETGQDSSSEAEAQRESAFEAEDGQTRGGEFESEEQWELAVGQPFLLEEPLLARGQKRKSPWPGDGFSAEGSADVYSGISGGFVEGEAVAAAENGLFGDDEETVLLKVELNGEEEATGAPGAEDFGASAPPPLLPFPDEFALSESSPHEEADASLASAPVIEQPGLLFEPLEPFEQMPSLGDVSNLEANVHDLIACV